jgi:hypothetical protein
MLFQSQRQGITPFVGGKWPRKENKMPFSSSLQKELNIFLFKERECKSVFFLRFFFFCDTGV